MTSPRKLRFASSKSDVQLFLNSWSKADADVLRNDLYDRPEVRTWTWGHVTLVGDAAHPMLPNLGQGACQALDDAVALGRALATLPADQALHAYEARRLKRANGFVAQSRLNGRLARSSNPALIALRNFTAAHLPRALVLRQLDATMGQDL